MHIPELSKIKCKFDSDLTSIYFENEKINIDINDTEKIEFIVGKYLKDETYNKGISFFLSSNPEVSFHDSEEGFLSLHSKKSIEKLSEVTGAVNPKVNSFREFPKYFNKLKKNNKVAMFCTGGIRCEKASNFLKQRGFKNVFQLKGGIFNYLNKINIKKSLWKGECFVFDNRVSVKHKLSVGSYSMCRGCRMPVSAQEKKSSDPRM